jgi:hypothetical protein
MVRLFYEETRCWMMAFTEDDERVERTASKWAERMARRFLKDERTWDKDFRRFVGRIQSDLDRKRNREQRFAIGQAAHAGVHRGGGQE